MPDIVTLTLNPALDKGSTVDRIVAQRKLRCSQPTLDPGGGGSGWEWPPVRPPS